jgi:hypothetical protein
MASRLEPDEPPETPRQPSQWSDFLPQMLANAAGTLLAAYVVYLYGVVSGLIEANWRLLVPIGVILLGVLLFAAYHYVIIRSTSRHSQWASVKRAMVASLVVLRHEAW